MTVPEIIYGLIGLLVGYFTTFITQKAKNDALKKDNEELALLKERGKNLATKEDIQEITKLQEEVKTTFQTKMEQQKAEISRISKEFELYIVKKHEHYPELYKNIELCSDKVQYLEVNQRGIGFERQINFRKFNKEDVKKYMSDKSFTEADKELILSSWDTSRNIAIRDLELSIDKVEYNEAQDIYKAAQSFFLLHRLFFSDEVSSIAKNILDNIYVLLVNSNPDYTLSKNGETQQQLREENEKLNEKIFKLRIDLFKHLQKELKTENKN
ncbi:hypothetical protein [Bacillus toyonensis]|uniref:hypothetical protein n=1 Tax=Bacillus toyonensis TaxID=155322 RepID=UPI000BEDC926|nr:hypothetical protein [Bacillus toyonensis]PEC65307.1 hypothetical protein CON62_22135 [Bacillus toyonensis]